MDDELMRLVTAIRDGNLRDPDRARRILMEAREVADAEWKRVGDFRSLVCSAEEAFLRLWQTPARTR